MEEKEYIGNIKSQPAYIVKQEEEIISVEKDETTTTRTDVNITYYRYTDEIQTNSSTTTSTTHVSTTIYLQNRAVSTNRDLKVTSGWHIRNIYLETEGKRHECGCIVAETGDFLGSYKSPLVVLKNLYDNTSSTGVMIEHHGVDVDGHKRSSIYIKEYPEDTQIKRCRITLILLWIVIPILYINFAGFLKPIDSKITEFILDTKTFAKYYFGFTLIITVIVSKISGKYKKLKTKRIEKELNEQKRNLYEGTQHTIKESFEEAFHDLIKKADNIANEYLKINN